MTGSELVAWLDGRRPAPPPALARRLRDAAADADASLPDHLAAHGRALLRRVIDGAALGEGRSLALDLLAADAFVTYAFEAQVERDVGGLGALAARIAGDAAGGS